MIKTAILSGILLGAAHGAFVSAQAGQSKGKGWQADTIKWVRVTGVTLTDPAHNQGVKGGRVTQSNG